MFIGPIIALFITVAVSAVILRAACALVTKLINGTAEGPELDAAMITEFVALLAGGLVGVGVGVVIGSASGTDAVRIAVITNLPIGTFINAAVYKRMLELTYPQGILVALANMTLRGIVVATMIRSGVLL
jgi:hypothetical protein